jgi:predicted O-methyltransferase YrrM
MVSPPDTVALLQLLMRLTGARNALEVGVFTGFTALGMGLARKVPGMQKPKALSSAAP